MGCFDYTCECGGKTCHHVGGQHCDSNVVIEVPLSDGRVEYLEGYYEQYGYVVVEGYHFYLEQFREYFEGWLENETQLEKIFVANKVWTVKDLIETTYETEDERGSITGYSNHRCFRNHIDVNLSEFDQVNYLKKYVRADKGYDLDERRKKRIERLKAQIEFMQKELGRLNRP